MQPEIQNDDLNKYNDIMTEVGDYLVGAEMLLDIFIETVLSDYSDKIFDIEIEIPGLLHGNGTSYLLKKISRESENGGIGIIIEDQNRKPEKIFWENLNLINKTHIANYIHLNLLSDTIFEQLTQ